LQPNIQASNRAQAAVKSAIREAKIRSYGNFQQAPKVFANGAIKGTAAGGANSIRTSAQNDGGTMGSFGNSNEIN
jgi:hypothetical protein